MSTSDRPDKFKITLRENGKHSLERGLEAYQQYDQSGEMMLLKDAIMFMHHGIELLMKDILVGQSQFLIFESLKDLPKKQIEADETGIDVFSIQSPPKTITYEEAISRVQAFVKPEALDRGLRGNLEKLNSLRNRLEHYAIEVDTKEVVTVLAALHDPLQRLFEPQLKGLSDLTPKTQQIWTAIVDRKAAASQMEEQVAAVMRLLGGLTIPGHLLGAEDDVEFPVFTDIRFDEPINDARPDLVGFAEHERWVVEVSSMGRSATSLLNRLAVITHLPGMRPWLVLFDTLPSETARIAKDRHIMVTDSSNWDELLEISQSASGGSLASY